MRSIIKIAIRNLVRYRRRTILTASLITTGVVFVIIYIAISGSFKNMIIGQITDSMLAHIQIHRNGYVASIENLPLNLTLNPDSIHKVEELLKNYPEVEAYSPRIKFGGMFSNFAETTNIRLNGVYPEKEFLTVPLLPERIISEGQDVKKQRRKEKRTVSLKPGEIWIPELLAQGMKVKMGDSVVIVVTNREGSVNGRPFTVSGILSSILGPGGRDGYVHFDDAAELLRMEPIEVSEIAVKIKKFDHLKKIHKRLDKDLTDFKENDKAIFEVHTWEGLSPFANIARIIDILTFFIRVLLVTIVLISIMNVMIMAVYERIREIGTLAAIGTLPEKIRNMFLTEGLLLGLVGSIAGILLSALIIVIVNLSGITFNFGMQRGIPLTASLGLFEIAVITLTVLLVSLAAAFYPAHSASRMEPVEALRHI